MKQAVLLCTFALAVTLASCKSTQEVNALKADSPASAATVNPVAADHLQGLIGEYVGDACKLSITKDEASKRFKFNIETENEADVAVEFEEDELLLGFRQRDPLPGSQQVGRTISVARRKNYDPKTGGSESESLRMELRGAATDEVSELLGVVWQRSKSNGSYVASGDDDQRICWNTRKEPSIDGVFKLHAEIGHQLELCDDYTSLVLKTHDDGLRAVLTPEQESNQFARCPLPVREPEFSTERTYGDLSVARDGCGVVTIKAFGGAATLEIYDYRGLLSDRIECRVDPEATIVVEEVRNGKTAKVYSILP